MKTELLWRLLQNEEYAKMTVGEFVKAVKGSWFMDEKKIINPSMNRAIAELTEKEGCRE